MRRRLINWLECKLRERYEPWTLVPLPPASDYDWWQAKVDRTMQRKHGRKTGCATKDLF